MILGERRIEALARTVTCPVCDRPPGQPCRYPTPFSYAHDGRLRLARGET